MAAVRLSPTPPAFGRRRVRLFSVTTIPNLETEQQHSRPVLPAALEDLDDVGPGGVTHGAVQPREGDVEISEQRLDDGEEAGELADHDHAVLGPVPLEPQHLLQDSVHLQF